MAALAVNDDSSKASASSTRRDYIWTGVAFVFVVIAPVASFYIRTAAGWALLGWVLAQVVATGLAFAIPQFRQVAAKDRELTAEEREIEAQVETRVAINDTLDPILRLLGEMSVASEESLREQKRAQAVPLVLAAATESIGPDRSRACWFRLEAGPPKQLVPVQAVGRAGSATTTFTEGTTSGDAAIGMVLADEDRLCIDIETEPPPGWDAEKTRDYRCFISVSVIAGDTAYGMLTLDAIEPGALTVEDKGLLRLMAGLLAIALSES